MAMVHHSHTLFITTASDENIFFLILLAFYAYKAWLVFMSIISKAKMQQKWLSVKLSMKVRSLSWPNMTSIRIQDVL